MGFWDRFRGIDSTDPAQRVLPEPFEPYFATGGIPVMDPGTPLELWAGGHRSDIEHFWRSQPNLRKVVDFIARSVASIPLNAYERVSDVERVRLSGEPLAAALRSPRRGLGPYRFWHAVLSDGLLYDRWAILKVGNDTGGLDLVHIPSWRLRIQSDPLRRVTAIHYWQGDRVKDTGDDQWINVPLDEVIFDHGYAPRTAGVSPVETLRDVLDENAEAVRYRRQLWEQGVRLPGYVYRPTDAPPWEKAQRSRFVESFKSAYGRNGPKAGGVPLLEDGMEIRSTDIFTPKSVQDIEGRRLTAIEVAAAFHLAPELVGAREGTYSNIDAFRQMLYGPNLGPYITAWEDTLNAQLVPDFAGGRSLYVEANVESKLRGSFLEQAQILQSAVGAPFMLINEARAMQNRVPIDGGDELIVPLNVTVGGQASPNDSGTQNLKPKSDPRVKAAPSRKHQKKIESVLSGFFERQGRSVLPRIEAGGDWWDGSRWDSELAADLLTVARAVADLLGAAEAKRLGFEGAFDSDRTVGFLEAVTARYAESINGTTKAQLVAQVEGDDEPDPGHVFEVAADSRAAGVGAMIGTFVAGFATVEAGRHIADAEDVTPVKTWDTGANPRSSHAAMNGQTVPIDKAFSNGQMWPGESGDPDEAAGCNCSVTVSIP